MIKKIKREGTAPQDQDEGQPETQQGRSTPALSLSFCGVVVQAVLLFPSKRSRAASVLTVSRSGSILQWSPSNICPWSCSSDQWSSADSSTDPKRSKETVKQGETRESNALPFESPERKKVRFLPDSGDGGAAAVTGATPDAPTIKFQTLSHSICCIH